MREKKENLLIFFLTFSIGSFFFFWKSYSYFLITSKKNISIFLIYSVFIFCENPQLSIKYFIEFFSFFVLGQFRRIHAKKNNNFPSLIFISIKNIKKNACTGEIFSKLLFYLTFSLPSGFSVDFSIFPLLSNEILNNKNIFRETTFLEKLLLRFAKKYSKKDLIKNLIIKNFLKSRFKLKIDNYFEYLSEDLNFTNFLLKKNGKVIIFLYIFLKKNCFDRLIYFSKWNLLLLLQAKKKYTDNIEKIKKIFCQKKKKEKKNKPSAIKNIFLNNLIQDFSYFFTLSPKNTSLFFFRKKSMDLKKYRKNISYNFEFECDNEFKKSKQIFKSNFSLKYFKNHKKLLRKLQKLKGKTFFADPNFFYEKQILENRVLFR